MGVRLDCTVAIFEGVCSVEEAEPVLGWIVDGVCDSVSLAACTHLHAAIIQLLMRGRVQIVDLPADNFLHDWVLPSLRAARDRQHIQR